MAAGAGCRDVRRCGCRTSEHQLQKSIVQYLNLVLPPDQRIVAVPNNPRSRVSGAFEKARGSRAGVPDLFLTDLSTG